MKLYKVETAVIAVTDGTLSAAGGDRLTVVVNPGAATRFVVTGSSSQIAGNSQTATVTAADAYGNTDTGYTGNHTITFTGAASSPGPVTAPTFRDRNAVDQPFGAANTSLTFTTGVASGTMKLYKVETAQIAAGDGTLNTTGADRLAVTVSPAAASSLALSGTPASLVAGNTGSVTVTSLDAYGNTATGYTGIVHFTSSDPIAALPSDYTFLAGDNGTKTFTNQYTLKTAGSRTVSATDTVTGSINGTSSSITVNPAGAATLSLTGTPGSVTAGTAASVTVTALDAFGNTATGYTGQIHFTSNDGAAVLPGNYTFLAGDNGTKTFTNAYTLKTAGSRTLTATDTVTGSINGAATITVNPAAAATLSLTGTPGSVTAGTAAAVTVTALDSFGNTATGYTGTVHFTSSDGIASLPSNYTFLAGDNGTKTFTNAYTLKTAGSQSLTATDTVTGSINGAASIAVNPAAAATLQVTAGTPQTAGTSFNVTVTAKDAFNNTATGYLGTVHFTSTDGAATLPGNYTFVGGDAGLHVFSTTLNTTGSRTITATDTVTGTITGTTATITVNAGAASTATSTISASPGSITADGSSTSIVTVQLKDALGNLVTGSGGTVALNTTSGSLGSVTDVGDGTYTANLTSSTTAGTATITGTLNGSAIASSTSVTFTPGPATTLVVTGPGSVTAGVATNVTVSAKDAHGNTATAYTGTVAFTSTDGTAVLPGNYTFIAGDNGSHTFTSGVTLKTAGPQTVTATDTVTGSITGTTSAITVNPAAPATIQISPAGTTQIAGTAFNLTVTVKDSLGNTATGYTGTVHFTSTDGAATLPGNYTFVGGDAGVHVFSTTLNTTGSRTITATDTVTGTITGTTATITVNAGAASTATSTISASPGSITADGSSTSIVTVQLKDALGNLVTGSGGTVALNTTSGSLGSVTDVGDGTYTANLTSSTTAGTATITGTLNGSAIASSTSVTFTAGAPTQYLVTSSSYSPVAGSTVTITAQLTDVNGNAVSTSGLTVNWSKTGAGGSFGAPTSTTNGSGVAAVSFTTSTVAGTAHTVTATEGSHNGTSSAITTIPGPATQYLVTSSGSSPIAGSNVTITAQLADANGNAVSTSGLTVTWSKTGAGGSFGSGTSTTNGSGVATVTFTTSTVSGTTHTVTGDDGTHSGTTSGFTTVPGAATTLTASAPASVTAGNSANVVVTAKDANGNTATGYTGTVHLTSTDGSAVLPGNYTFVAGDNGSHTLAVTLKTVGSRTVTATDTVTSSITGTTGSIAVGPAPAATFDVTAAGSSTAGNSLNVTITARDPYGNVATGYTGIAHLTSSDGSAVLPADYIFVAGDNGVKTLSVTLKTAGNQTVTATDTVTNTITGTTGTIAVSPATATTLELTGTPASVTAGNTGSVTVTAKDAYGNTATGYTGTVHFTSSDPIAVLPSDYAFLAGDNGAKTFTNAYTLKTAGSQSLTATDTVTGSITGVSSGITVNPAAAATFSVSAAGSSTAGNSVNATVTARDSFGNVATGYTGTVHLTSSDGSAVLPADYTFVAGDNGVKTLSVTLKTAGNQTVTATDTVTNTITGTTGTIAVAPAAAATLFVSASPTTVTAGNTTNVTVTAKDAYNNVATGYTGTVHFTSTDGLAVLPANYTFVAGDNGTHIFSATLKTAGSQTLTATDTVSSSVNGTSTGITVNAAAVSGTVSTAVASPTSVPADGSTTSTVTVTLTDAFGNPRAGKTVTLAQTGSSSISAASGPSDASGVVTFMVTDTTAEGVTYTATDTTDSVTLTQTPHVTFAIGSLDHIVISPSSSTVAAGVSQSYTVEGFDAFNNSLGDFTGGASFSITPDGTCPGAGASCSATAVGAHTVTATYAGKTDTSALTVVSAPADSSASTISAVPSSITANGSSTSAVTVQLKDIFGNNRASGGNIVALATTAGSLSAVTDNGNGTYSATLTSSTSVGTASITGTLDGVAIVSAASVTFTPGAATHFAVTGAASTTAGVAASVTVTAKDAFGNTATGYTDTVHFTSSDGGATLPANYAFAAGDSGAHTFSATLTTAGSQTVTATDTVTASITGSHSITVDPAAATSFDVTTAGGPETAGGAFNVTVTARDAFGNVATGYTGTVHFTSTDGAAGLPADYAFVAGDSGVHVFSVTLKTAGPETVTATQGGVTGTTPSITVVSGALDHFTLTGTPATVVSGTPASVVVTAQDAYANTVTGYTGAVHFSSNDPAAVLPGDYTFTGANAGSHTFTNAYTLLTTGARTVTATDTVSPAVTGTSAFIAVTPGAASGVTSTIVASPTSIQANGTSTSTLTVQLKDVTGNNLTAGGNNVVLSATNGGAIGPITDNGNGTYTATLTSSTVAGVSSISGTVDAAPIAVGATVTFTPGPATSFDVTGPATATAGTAGNYTVTTRDAFGNTATGYLGTVHVTSSDAQATLPADHAFTAGDAGVHVFSVTLKTAGSQTVTATDTVTATITGTSTGTAVTGLGVDAGASTVTANPPTVVADGSATVNVTVTLKDQYGNPVAGKAVTVLQTGSASLSSGGTGTSDAAGVAAFTATDTTPEHVVFSATGDGVALTQQAAMDFTNGALDHIKLTPASSSISADGPGQTYTVTGYDSTNHSLGDLTATSTFTITPDGSCVNATATCIATTAGAHVVTAHNSGFTDTATLTVNAGAPSTLNSTISASPTSVVADNTTSTITVRLKDAAGNNIPSSGGTVVLSSTVGTPSPVVTDNGNGTYTATVKSTLVGTASITGTLNSVALASSATVTFTPGPASVFVLSSPASATAGSATTVTVTAKDQYGNLATGYTGTVHFTSTDGAATLPADYTFVAGDNGANTFPATLKTAGTQTITAVDGTIIGTTGSIGVTPGPVSTTASTVTRAPASVPADNSSTSTVTVTLNDAYGNTVPGKVVTLGAGAGSSTWTPLTDTTNGSGVASFSAKDTVVENVVYNAVDTTDAKPLTDTATVAFTAGPLFTITLNPANATVAAGVGQAYTVRGYDAFGHDLGDVTPSTSLSINPNGSCVTDTCTATVAGLHTVIATNTGHTATANLTVTPGAASPVLSTITATPGSITADGVSTSTITVHARDQYGNALTTGGDTVKLSTSNGSLAPTSPLAATDHGDGTYTAVLTSPLTPGSATVDGTLNGTALTNNVVVTFGAVLPGPADATKSTITASPTTIQADGATTSTITVRLKDAAGLNLTAGGDTVLLSTDNGSLVPADPVHATDNGNGTYTATLTSPLAAGTAHITGKLNGTAMTDTATVTFTAGPPPPPGPADPTTSTITASPTTIVGDGVTTSTVTVQLKDASGTNLVAGGDTVLLSSSSGTLAPADPTQATDNANGTYTAILTSPVGAGSATITGKVNGVPITANATVTFTSAGSPPTLVTATATGSTLILTYDQTLDGTSVPPVTDFSVLQNATLQGTPTGVTVSGTTVTISLASPVVSGDVVTVSYSGTAIKNLTGQSAATLTNAPVTVGGTSPTPTGPVVCKSPNRLDNTGKICIPQAPPPPIVFLGTNPADGAILGSVGSITFNANHDASWYAITLTHDGDAPVDLLPGSGASYTTAFTASAPGTYTIDAWMDDGFNPRQHVHAQFTIVGSGIPGVGVGDSRGSVDAGDGVGSASWPAGTFSDPVIVRMDIVTKTGIVTVPPGSFAYQVTATRLRDGSPVHVLGGILDVQFKNAPLDGTPSTSEDGLTWRPVPTLPALSLPDGQPDGAFRDSANTVHILTRHLTYFALFVPSATKLAFQVVGTVRYTWGVDKYVGARISLTQNAMVTARLYSPKGIRLKSWLRPARVGNSILKLKLPPSARKPGTYRIKFTARAKSGVATQSIRVRVLPTLKLGSVRKTQGRAVVLSAPAGNAIAAKLHGLRTSVVSGGADDTFRATANGSRNVVVIVLDADRAGIATIRDLHTIFPDVRIVALSADPSLRAHAVPAGATLALPSSTPAALVAKTVARLAAL